MLFFSLQNRDEGFNIKRYSRSLVSDKGNISLFALDKDQVFAANVCVVEIDTSMPLKIIPFRITWHK